jgi:RimJ/RimL family protein N-acetyltransferase
VKSSSSQFPRPLVFALESERFIFRTLTVADASERWCEWTADPHAALMLNAPRRRLDMAQLQAYIEGFDQIERIMVGLFDRKSGQHFGLFTGEYVDDRRRIMPSLLIGEPRFRHSGVLKEMRETLQTFILQNVPFESAVAPVLSHNEVMIRYLESQGWTLLRRLPGEKKRADGQGYLDVLLYELPRHVIATRLVTL